VVIGVTSGEGKFRGKVSFPKHFIWGQEFFGRAKEILGEGGGKTLLPKIGGVWGTLRNQERGEEIFSKTKGLKRPFFGWKRDWGLGGQHLGWWGLVGPLNPFRSTVPQLVNSVWAHFFEHSSPFMGRTPCFQFPPFNKMDVGGAHPLGTPSVLGPVQRLTPRVFSPLGARAHEDKGV